MSAPAWWTWRNPLFWFTLACCWVMFVGVLVALTGCQQAGPYLDKGCAAIHEADAACQWLTIIKADGTMVRVPKAEGIAAMRKAGLEQPAPK